MHWRARQTGIDFNSAISAVNKHGLILVYPIANREKPISLWSHFFPQSKMRWVWDENGDNRVVHLWDLRERISRSNRVVYSKWYQGRATFLSREVFTALLGLFHEGDPSHPKLSRGARDLLDHLSDNSPQTTKVLKKHAKKGLGWQNREYEAAMKELWLKFLIIGCGEVDDGAFPSLNVGATELMFEDLWSQAHGKDTAGWQKLFKKYLPEGSPWFKNYQRISVKPKQKAKKAGKSTLYYKDLVTKR
jgi:hypothetical protein